METKDHRERLVVTEGWRSRSNGGKYRAAEVDHRCGIASQNSHKYQIHKVKKCKAWIQRLFMNTNVFE